MGKVILKAKNIDKSYSNGKHTLTVLKNFCLDVNQGEIITIMGQSGSGKSTALNILGTLDDPESGAIFINDNQISNLSDNEISNIRNQYIGFVFQFHHLLPEFTAIENILMPTWISGNENRIYEADQLLLTLNLMDRKNHFPNQLSGGERSRIAIARALINKPAVLLADEPTGNLDKENANKLVNLLIKINNEFDQAIVLTTHNPEVADIGHKQFILENGSLAKR
tara:strand:- start:79 stop:753 length:675 start_codon:yes stop_codon:yes gene_type:complete